MDLSNLIDKQIAAAELLADALAMSVKNRDATDTIRDLANATAITIDKLMTLRSIEYTGHERAALRERE